MRIVRFLDDKGQTRLGRVPIGTMPVEAELLDGDLFGTLRPTGKNAAIGAIADLQQLLTGDAGTTVSRSADGITFGSDRQVSTTPARSVNPPRHFGALFPVNAPASLP